MKTWLKNLIPAWLTRLDQWLLTHHPMLWRSQVLWLLALAVPATLILFGLGLFWPTSTVDPVIEPVGRYLVNDRDVFGWILAMGVLAMAYWGYLQFRYRGDYPGFKGLMANWGVYLLGGFLMLPVLTTAFSYGELLRHAYGMMDQEDIDELQKNSYYAYGISFSDEASLLQTVQQPSKDRLAAAQQRFRTWVNEEHTWNKELYSLDDYWSHTDIVEEYVLEDHLGEPYVNSPRGVIQSHYAKLHKLYLLQRTRIPRWAAIVDSNYYHYRSTMGWEARQGTERSGGWAKLKTTPCGYDSSGNYINHDCYPAEDSILLQEGPILNAYDRFYWQENAQPPTDLLAKYKIPYRVDTLIAKEIILHLPRHVYQLEDLVNSVQNAQAAVKYGAAFDHWFPLIVLLVIASWLFLGLPYLKARTLFVSALILGLVTMAWLMGYKELMGYRAGEWQVLHEFGSFLLVELFALVVITLGNLRQRQSRLTSFAFHLHLLSLVGTFMLMGENRFEWNAIALALGVLFMLVAFQYPRLAALPHRK
ncbi:MAG: hypothetical protein AAF804_02480 [Bacteroidota bacterium]